MYRKVIIIFVIMCVTFGLTACGGANVDVSDTSEQQSAAESLPINRGLPKILVSQGCTYTAKGQKHAQYPDDGTKLTDGVLGSDIGVGWSTSKGEFVLDFGETRSDLADFDILLRGDNWGIVAPEKAEYFISDDGNLWQSVGTSDFTKTQSDGEWYDYSYLLQLENAVTARYVKFEVTGGGMNYAWAFELCVWSYMEQQTPEGHMFTGKETFNNLTYSTPLGKYMGDNDGPAYCVYSQKGYNKSEFVFELSKAQPGTSGDGGRKIAAYIFLGANAYDGDGNWINCCDAGFKYCEESQGWQLFAATATDKDGNRGWFAGNKSLPDYTDYRLVLDTSLQDGYATVTAYDIRDNSVCDQLTFPFYGVTKDGKNTNHLTDIAIDWANDNTFKDENGVTLTDFQKITEANLGKGMFLKNIRIYGCKLYKNGTAFDWTEELTDFRGIYPEKGFGTLTTEITSLMGDTEYIVNITLEK